MIKAIIPVAGVGVKLRPHTHTQPKPLMPVAGKPILGHIIDGLLNAGISHQIFVLGYMGEKIREYVEMAYGDKIEAEFVIQEPRKGLAQAVGLCKNNLEGVEEVLIVLGDTLFDKDISSILQKPGNQLGVKEVQEPRKFGVAVLDDNGLVKSVIEKPEIPMSNLAMVGLYKFADVSLLLAVIDKMLDEKAVVNGQYLLTDAIMGMMQKRAIFQVFTVENWYDCGSRASLLDTHRILMKNMRNLPQYEFENTVILPPVYIAPGCEIRNSIIGPYVAIAENARIINSIVSNAILGAYSSLDSIVLNESLLGTDTSLKGKAHSVNIGDDTDINFDE